MSEDWTETYRPRSLAQIRGNPKAVRELTEWAQSWDKGRPSKKAVVLKGPPGVGKTSAALALANDMSWGVVEMNASDQRTGEAIRQVALRAAYSNTFTAEGEYLSSTTGGRKLIILDEADNLFGREDRGAMPAIVELIKETMQPVILIVNDFYELSRRSSALKSNTLQINFFRPRVTEIAKVLTEISRDRGITVDSKTLNIIAANATGDLRAAIRDMESLSLGRKTIVEEDALNLSGRVVRKDMYDLMDAILRSGDPAHAHRIMSQINEQPDHVMLWLDENMPYEYRDPGDLVRGYEKLSRADIFLGRVRRRQYYRFWSYASDLMSYGVSQARLRSKPEGQRFRFPLYLMKMSRSKSARNMRNNVTAKIAAHCHTSVSRGRNDILPYMQIMFRENASFRTSMIPVLGLEIEEVAFLMGEKIDSPKVKAAMRGDEEVETIPRKRKHAPRGDPRKPSNPLPPQGQKSLWQF